MLGALDIFYSAPLAVVALVPIHQFVQITVVGAQRSFTSSDQLYIPIISLHVLNTNEEGIIADPGGFTF